jgi:hypothetical protein
LISPAPFPNLSALRNLVSIAFSDSKLSGNIPDVFGNMLNLLDVEISFTQLGGAIPPTLFTRPRRLNLEGNLLSAFPSSLSSLCTLELLKAPNNSLDGLVSPVLSSCESLRDILLSTNTLGPELPASLLDLPFLLTLSLRSNRFSSIGASPNNSVPTLTPREVDLTSNQFSGPMSDNLMKTIILRGRIWYDFPVSPVAAI